MAINPIWTPYREKRFKLGLRQSDVAVRAGIPQARYSRIEREVVEPSPDELSRLNKVLDEGDSGQAA